MEIKEYPLTPSFYVLLFQARGGTKYHVNKEGSYVIENNKFICTEISNHRNLSFKNKETIGDRIGTLTEENCIDIFNRAGVSAPFINYYNVDNQIEDKDVVYTAKESLFSYIKNQGWSVDLNNTCIVVLKKSKQLVGKKIPMEFNVGTEDFGYGESIVELLDVYMTPITKKSKSVTFSVYIPKTLYNMCMTHVVVEERPLKTYIEADTISSLHAQMKELCSKAHFMFKLNRDSETAKKIIVINFNASDRPTRDDYNHAYTGEQISINFNYFVAYKTIGGVVFNYQKYSSGFGLKNQGIKGVIDTYKFNDKQHIKNTKMQVVIDWTEEQENYLKNLEQQFVKLSENLNVFLKDLTQEKLLELMSNNKIKLIQ